MFNISLGKDASDMVTNELHIGYHFYGSGLGLLKSF